MRIRKDYKFILMLASLVILAFSIYIRIKFILSQALFVDEFTNISESIAFTGDILHFPINYSLLLSDPVKPVFYRLFFGFSIIPFNYMHSILTKSQVTLFPSNLALATQYARLSMLLLNVVCYLFILRENSKKIPFFTFFLITFIALNPLLIFNTSLAQTSSFIIPLSLLFIFFLSRADPIKVKTLLPVSFLSGLLLSIQYYSFIFIIYSFLVLATKAFVFYKEHPFEVNRYYIIFIFSTFLILLPAMVFIILNPSYWNNPYNSLLVSLRSVTFPLSKTSGIGNLNSFSLGRSVSNAPFYETIFDLILQVPLLEIFLFVFGAIFLLKHLITKGRVNTLITLGYVSLFILLGNIIFTSTITHFRGISSVSTLLLIPFLIVAAIGADELFSYCYSYVNTHIKREKVNLKSQRLRKQSYRTNNSVDKVDKKMPKLTYILPFCIFLLLVSPVMYNSSPSFSYANLLGLSLYKSGDNIDGALNSAQSDMMVAKYMDTHDLNNITVISLALTADLSYYAPSNTYLQFWPTEHPVNTSYLLTHYFSDYLVIDDYYAQLYGKPVQGNSTDFPLIYRFSNSQGYSILYHIGPLPYVNFSSIIASFPIKIPNIPSHLVGSNFILPLQIKSKSFEEFEFENLTNVEFSFEKSGEIIPSYLYRGNNYLTNNTEYFLKFSSKLDGCKSISINIDFSRNNVMNGFYVGGNPLLFGIKNQWDNGNYIFNYYKSFKNNYSGYYILNQNANSTIKFYNGANFYGAGSGRAYLGSLIQVPLLNTTTITQVYVGYTPPNSNSEFILTPWTPNGSISNYGIKIENNETFLFANNDQAVFNLDNTTLYVKLEVDTSNYSVVFYSCSLNMYKEIFSYNGTLRGGTTMAPAYEQYFYNGVFSATFSVKTVIFF